MLGVAPVAACCAAQPAEALRPLELAPRGFWIQLRCLPPARDDGAESFQRRVADELDWLAPRPAVFVDTPLFRLQAGPHASQ